MKTLSLAAAALAALFATSASAAITTYADLGAFNAAAGPTALFDFNATPNGSFDGASYDVGPFTLIGDSTDSFSDMQVSGQQVSANVCGVGVCGTPFGYTFTFDAPITAFGAFFSNALGASGLTFTVGGDVFAGPAANSGFFGFTSTAAFTTIAVSGANEVHNFDDVRFGGAAVPEPSTWALLIGGFGLAGSALRRRRLSAA